MRNVALTAGTVLITGMLAAGCADTEEQEGPEAAPETEERATETHGLDPDTTAEALWAHLEQENYREGWRLWPGTEELYQGSDPHGILLTTYANDVAHRALQNGGVEDLPAGAIIVKENYMPDSSYDAATVMYRVEGYNAEHDDWLFAKFDAQGEPDAFGRAPMCQACHSEAETGYVYTELPTQ